MREKNQIARLIRDIDEIKAAVRRNRAAIRELAAASLFPWLIIAFGITAVVVAFVLQYIVSRYGSYAALPPSARVAIWAVLAAALAALSAAKIAGIRVMMKRIDPGLTLWKMVTTQYPGALHLSIPVALIGAAVAISFGRAGQAAAVIGVCGITFGLVSNILAVAVLLPEYFVYGYWLMASGGASFFILGVPAPVWAAIVLGGGSFAFALTSALLRRSGRPARDRDA